MPKNIAFFADGTWNGPDQDDNDDGILDPTNVFLLFDHLQGTDTPESKLLQNEQEQIACAPDGSVTQVSKYIHGVGDSRSPIRRVVEGTFGAGLINRIVRGYTFISRWYEPGDRIYIVGFSRGAYTARALGGMICSVGLLKSTLVRAMDKETAYRYGVAAWLRYREKAGKKASLLDFIRYKSAAALENKDLVSDVPIEAIGVWDTVGALGIPDYAAGQGRSDVFQFADKQLNKLVRHGFHAVSIHEQRGDFVPTLWDSTGREGISEVWFAGSHSDVGGGYPRRDLSDIALQWMGQQLEQIGLAIKPGWAGSLAPIPGAQYYTPWTKVPWSKLPLAVRAVPANAVRHPSAGPAGVARPVVVPQSGRASAATGVNRHEPALKASTPLQ
jgi:glutathione S-transferase